MKILLDSCVWGGALDDLRDAGHDVGWSGEWESDPGDEEILARAREESRVLITLDKDFGELAIVRNVPHCGIIRLVGVSAKQQAAVTLNIISKYVSELSSGAIVTVSDQRVRIRSGRS